MSKHPESLSLTAAIEEAGRSGSKTYKTEGGPVEVTWRKFDPDLGVEGSETKKREPLAQAIIFLPGSMMDADSKFIEPLIQTFADYAAKPAYIVSTRAENPSGDMSQFEAEAIRQFLEEHGLSEVVITGYSRGGGRAIDTVDALRKNHSANVKGMVLINSVGLYEQKTDEFSETSVNHIALDIPQAILNSKERPHMEHFKQAAADTLTSFFKEFMRSKAGFSKRLDKETESMAKLNDRIPNIDVPVVLVFGAEDAISDPEKVAPTGEEPSELEAHLKKHLFKQSPYVKMIVAAPLKTKGGHHALPILRPASVARSSLYMLERFWRAEKPKT